ncbi:MAG: hypothetical protein AB1813_25425 [Verrucomicrobiota bacterium]
MMKFAGVLFPLALTICAGATEPNPTRQKIESFDADPQWEGKNNRAAPARPEVIEQDFGYAATNRSGKVVGRIGGKFSQSTQPAYYAKAITACTLENPLAASGCLTVEAAQSISGWHTTANIFVGWFNADERDLIWRPRNFIGFRLQSSNEPDGAIVELTYGTQAWQAGGRFVNTRGGGQERLVRELNSSALLRIAPDGARHRWSFQYHPQAAGGAGEMIFTFDGAETRFSLDPVLRKAGASFNRFGFFTPRIPGRHMIAWFEDLEINGRKEVLDHDPLWDALGNRARFPELSPYGHNQFGFASSDYAGGAPGEMGGRFFSCNPEEESSKAFYADRIGHLTLAHRLTARGRFVAKEFCIDSSFALGWFNARKQGWPLENFVGVYFDSLSDSGRIAMPIYGTKEGSESREGNFVLFEPGKKYEWKLDYDPAGANGQGAITFTLGNRMVTRAFRDGDKAKGALLDRFGVCNLQWANSKWCDVYLDDLNYTVEAP